jgi:hypothetical protein
LIQVTKTAPLKGIAGKSDMGVQAKKITEFFKTECGDFAEGTARHAEENFITKFPSIVGEVAPQPVTKVSIYMNFSPCLDQSTARTIADMAYSAGCLNKLKELAVRYNQIAWHVHYDEYFTSPSTDANQRACRLTHAGFPNMFMYKLKV